MPTSTVAPDTDRHVRKTDPGTSREAAAGITGSELTALQFNILAIIREHGPVTDEGIWEHYNALGLPRRTPQRLRTARAEMTAGARHLIQTPRVRPAMSEPAALKSGYHGRVFEVIPEEEN